MKKLYRIWFSPFEYPDESDYVDGSFDSKEEAKEFGRCFGCVETVVEIEEA